MTRVPPTAIGLLFLFTSAALFPQSADYAELQRRLDSAEATPGAGELLVSALQAAPSVREARNVYSLHRQLLTTDAQREAAYRELGKLEELAGNFKGALEMYETLLELTPREDPIRLRAAAAALETGEYERARRHSQYIIDSARNGAAQREAALYLGLSYFHQENEAQALPILQSLTRGDDPRILDPRALVFSLLAARSWDESAYAEELESKLQRHFPESLDRLALAGDGPVSLAPRPSVLLPLAPWEEIDLSTPLPQDETSPRDASVEGAAESEDTPATTAGGESGATGNATDSTGDEGRQLVVGIQTGSFTDRENATVMRDEIRKQDIPAQVRSVELQGRTYYRVVVPTEGAVPPAQAQELVVRLKELGVEGFLLFQ